MSRIFYCVWSQWGAETHADLQHDTRLQTCTCLNVILPSLFSRVRPSVYLITLALTHTCSRGPRHAFTSYTRESVASGPDHKQTSMWRLLLANTHTLTHKHTFPFFILLYLDRQMDMRKKVWECVKLPWFFNSQHLISKEQGGQSTCAYT